MRRLKLMIVVTVIPFLLLTGCGGNDQGYKRENMAPLGFEQNDVMKPDRKQLYSRLQEDEEDQGSLHGQISSQQTNTPSNKYPHTTAVQIQHAKYAFITVDEKGKQKTITLPDNITNQLPNNIEQLTPEEIVQYLPKNVQKLLPKGSEHLTPETIAKLIKESGVKQPKGEKPAGKKDKPEAKQPATPPATNNEETKKEEQTPPASNKQMSELEKQVVELTNQERRKNGLPDLQIDTALSNVARTKSQDMQANNYFSHTSPTYGSPFDMMRDFGISYNAAAENIAQGQRTAQEVVQAWMNSSGHRANILNRNYTHIGVGHDPNGNYWTQMFISK